MAIATAVRLLQAGEIHDTFDGVTSATNAMDLANETYTIGDLLPAMDLPDAQGTTVSLSSQNLAGNVILLWVTGPDPDPRLAAGLCAAGGLLADLEVIVFAVTPDRPVDGIATLYDRGSRLARSVGLTGPGMILLDSEMRLVAVLFGEGCLAQAISAVARLRDRTAETTVSALPPVVILPDVIDASLCKRLIDYWENNEKQVDRVIAPDGEVYQSDDVVKRRADVRLVDQALLEEVSRCIGRRVLPMIHKAFQRTVTRCEAIRVGCYDAARQGMFARHRDNTLPKVAHRLFAMSVNLNDAYTGGQVRFPEYSRALVRPDAGGAVIFSCSLLHEALPVRSGRRFGLFTFLYDEDGETERQKFAREMAAG